MNTSSRQPSTFKSATPSFPGRSQPSDGVEVIMPDQYSDRRSEPRQARDDTGVLLFLSDNQIITCRILDSSATGARVAIEALAHIPSEIWLIDLNSQMVKRGSAAWSMANRMGLKFNFIQKLAPGDTRPVKVPQEVYDAWLRLTNGPAPVTQEEPKPEEPGDDVLYFD